MKHLVIVESPAKAKTITKLLGSEYTVKSSIGHIRDLPAKGMNIDIANNFKPNYEVATDKKKVVRELKEASKLADEVILASDEDREGEAIAWHLSEVLKLDPTKTKRIVFHEITKPAIASALKNPRLIDLNLVDAQQARRILDRLVGYELSPVLWKKIRPGISAGRVQSVAVRLIVEREREIDNFKAESSYKVVAKFNTSGAELVAELKVRLHSKEDVLKLLNNCKDATFSVADTTKKPAERNPSAPFTTSTLQQEAARKLGFSVKQTMNLAQRLYENGHITYMRTDSTNLSGISITAMSELIKQQFGPQYLKVRQYKTKNASAQEAHEAIRPTNFNQQQAGQDELQQKLYKLIWNRTVASQMAPARIEQTNITINISKDPNIFMAKGEIIVFDGFYKIYGGGKEDQILPNVANGEELNYLDINATETYSRPPSRFTEASLVRTLEELGIGRPSTYAPTINTIQARGYVERIDIENPAKELNKISLNDGQISETTITDKITIDKNKLSPTHLAGVTTDFLVKQFANIVDSSFTAKAEAKIDQVAEGQEKWQDFIKDFYKDFHPQIAEAENATRSEASQARLVGNDPKSGEPIYARYGKFGPMLQKGETTEEKKPAFAPLPEGVSLDKVTLEEALTMFTLPRLVGQTKDGRTITANIGRFGPYIQIDKTYVSIKPLSPFEVDEAKANELYAQKLDQDKKKDIKEFSSDGLKVLNGPFGAYVTDGKKNARIPKSITPQDITLEQAKELIAKAKPAKKRKKIKK
jgi:DNA topoisomerase-1